MKRYLLDTGMLVGYARKAEFAKRCDEVHQLSAQENLVITSIVAEGELLALAEKRGWGGEKRKAFELRLRQFSRVDINSEAVLSAYAQIKSWSEGAAPPSAPSFPPPPKPARKLGQNDMWIAATALVTKSTLITLDKDFDTLAEAGIIERIYVDQHVD